MVFVLHPQLMADTFAVTELPLCTLRWMNNRLFPWAILVPKRENMREIIDLSPAEQHQLMDEITQVSHAMKTLHTPDKLNVAALGNVVKQLHIHIIARYALDAAWPNPVWGKGAENYGEGEHTKPISGLLELLR